jgi:hypothetical protein
MDLFSPNPDRDKYGARAKKNVRLLSVHFTPGRTLILLIESSYRIIHVPLLYHVNEKLA